MEPLEKFMSRRHRYHGARFVWRHFRPCACNPEFAEVRPHPQTLDDLGVEAIEERRRRLIERDYYRRPVNSYDYRFRFADDPEHVHVLESNVRMLKFYSGKWHWFVSGIESRLYTIRAEDDARTRWPRTYPVDDNGRRYSVYDSETDTYDYTAHKWKKYKDFFAPYSNLREFSTDVPEWAVSRTEIPKEWEDAHDRAQRVALVLLFTESEQFASGK